MTKSQSTKHQQYTYSFKSAATADPTAVRICRDKFAFWLVPPQDALTIEYLFTHLKIQFESSVPSADRVIKKIGIISQFNYNEWQADYFNALDVNLTADVNREIEIKMNLSSLLKKDNVHFTSDPLGADFEEGYTFIWVKLADGLAFNNQVGKVLLWKADGLFTTTGIR